MQSRITPAEFERLTQTLVGLPVSRTWRGAGSAIFLEVGTLRRTPQWRYGKGEFTIMAEWSWRVERPRSVLFGSFSASARITNQLQKLTSERVESVSLAGRLPELVVALSGSLWLHAFTTVEGQPQWALYLPDGSWICVHRGVLVRESGGVVP